MDLRGRSCVVRSAFPSPSLCHRMSRVGALSGPDVTWRGAANIGSGSLSGTSSGRRIGSCSSAGGAGDRSAVSRASGGVRQHASPWAQSEPASPIEWCTGAASLCACRSRIQQARQSASWRAVWWDEPRGTAEEHAHTDRTGRGTHRAQGASGSRFTCALYHPSRCPCRSALRAMARRLNTGCDGKTADHVSYNRTRRGTHRAQGASGSRFTYALYHPSRCPCRSALRAMARRLNTGCDGKTADHVSYRTEWQWRATLLIHWGNGDGERWKNNAIAGGTLSPRTSVYG